MVDSAQAPAAPIGPWRAQLQHFIDLGVNHSPGLRRRVLELSTRGYAGVPGALPLLPAGRRITVGETSRFGAPTHIQVDGGNEDDEVYFEAAWNQIERHIFEDVDDDYVTGTAGEVWPAAVALCEWLSDHQPDFEGRRVIELGAGMGACGLHAAALGASYVLLTDLAYASEAYRGPCQRNVDANRELFAPGSTVELTTLEWGAAGVLGPLGSFDWVLVSDCTFGQYALDALCATIAELLRGSRPPAARPPRVLLAHEHRYRGPDTPGERGMPWLRTSLSCWDDGDEHLDAFSQCAARHSLTLRPLQSRRPCMRSSMGFRWWTADLSIVEVVQHNNIT